MSQRVAELAAALRDADQAVAFTGAGVSTASGIPDFRSDEGGIWTEHEPREFHINAFEQNPGKFWERLLDMYDEAFGGNHSPNAAHRAIASLEDQGYLEAVITQNGDRLHQAAGSETVIELHGSLEEVVCRSCPHRESFDEARSRVDNLPPDCPECGGPLKPAGILFGEALPRDALFRAQALAEQSDVFIVAGSSLTVEPAASLPETATRRGGTVAIVNRESTPLDSRASFTFHGDVTEVLPQLVEAI